MARHQFATGQQHGKIDRLALVKKQRPHLFWRQVQSRARSATTHIGSDRIGVIKQRAVKGLTGEITGHRQGRCSADRPHHYQR